MTPPTIHQAATKPRLLALLGTFVLLLAVGCTPTPTPPPPPPPPTTATPPTTTPPTTTPPTTTPLPAQKVSVSLTFDDATSEHALVGELLAQRNVHGTFFVNSNRVGHSGYLSWADIATLAAQGNEIGGHTLDHLNLVNISEQDARTQVCNDRANLVDQGYDPVSFAYPFAANNDAVEQIAADCGYTWARDVGGLKSATSCSGCPSIQVVPAPKPLVLRTNGSVRNDTTLAEMKTWVEQAEATGLTGTVPIVVHRMCDNNCDTYSTTQAMLEQFMDWLIVRGTPIKTLSGALTPPVAP